MILLGAKLYDPAVAVTKNTTAATAMAALDTTNLRIAFTIPSHGNVRVRLMGVIHGATTYPSILLGVMNGATVVGRVAPVQSLGNTAVATALVNVEADFVISGLTPGSVNWDAAYGTETLVAATGIKYGGPNNTTANDAFGGFVFEVWDPMPNPTNFGSLSIDANGRVDVIKVAGTSQTARDLGAQLDAAVSTRMATYTQPTGFLAATFPVTVASTTNITAGTITTVTNLTNAPTAGDFTATMKTSLNAATPAVTVSDKTGFSLSAAANNAIRDTILTDATRFAGANLDATISSRLPTSSYTAPLTAATTRTALGMATANLDSQLSTIDTDVLARLATSGYTAPDNASITSIKAKTDSLTFSVANTVDSNIRNVNNIAVNGLGTAGNPWGP